MRPHANFTAGVAAMLAAALGGTPASARAQVQAQAQTQPQETCAGDPSNAKLHVVVQGVRSDEGVVTATLYGADPALWLKSGGDVKVSRADAQTPVTKMCFWLPGTGTYAVAVYHDAKRANRFVRGTFGPTQDYGFSRNPHIFLGPPSLNQVKFPAVEGETTIFIKLKHP
jgi:uncharacterized protein (DUF2141 family)